MRPRSLVLLGAAVWVAGIVLLIVGNWQVGSGLLLLGVVCAVLGVLSRFPLMRRLLDVLSFWS